MLAYSAGGTLLAFAAMFALARVLHAGPVPASMAGAVMHNVGQLCVAAAFLGSGAVFVSLPALAIAACVTGFALGAVAAGVIDALEVNADERPYVELEGLEILPGEHVAFVGPCGSGKTTAALQLAGLSGGCAAPRLSAGVVFQDPDNQLVAERVEDDVAFALENRGHSPEVMRGEVASALQQVGLTGFEERRVCELSGGQKQLLACAGVLAMAPQLIVFDEASSMLDPLAQRRFMRLVKQLCAQGYAVITITQIEHEALEADRVVRFENLRVAEMRDDVWGQCPGCVRDDERGRRPSAASARIELAERGLSIEAGEVLGIAGLCGAGKSYLLAQLAQAAGRDVAVLVQQRPERQLFARTAWEDVAFGPRNLGLEGRELEERVAQALRAVNLGEREARCKSPFAYSGGEQRRLALAGMLALNTPFLLLDEPTAGLDQTERERLAGLLLSLKHSGVGIALVSHDLEFLGRVCDRCAVLEREGEERALCWPERGQLPAAFLSAWKQRLLAGERA
ncbi:MAG: Gx transporter family protein [Coriobacteriales bacterium]